MKAKLMGWFWLLVLLLAACTGPGGGQAEAGLWDQSQWDQASWQ
ncbi:hypothetical protein [Thermus caldilimi]|nr:hypothetical protein [Thermus caldilimi]